jgi:hypothetical protein
LIATLRELSKYWSALSYNKQILIKFFNSLSLPHLNETECHALSQFFINTLSKSTLSEPVKLFLPIFYKHVIRVKDPHFFGGLIYAYDEELLKLWAAFDLRQLKDFYLSRAQFLYDLADQNGRQTIMNIPLKEQGNKPLAAFLDTSFEQESQEARRANALYKQLIEYARTAPFPKPTDCTEFWLQSVLPSLNLALHCSHYSSELIDAIVASDFSKLQKLTATPLPQALNDCCIFIALLTQQTSLVTYFAHHTSCEALDSAVFNNRLEFLTHLVSFCVYEKQAVEIFLSFLSKTMKNYTATHEHASDAFIRLRDSLFASIQDDVYGDDRALVYDILHKT